MKTLQEIREEKGLTQESLSEKTGVKRESISRYESGSRRPSPEVAEKIAQALEMDVATMWQVLYGGRREESVS